MIVIFQSARGCCACETNCNALYYAMPIETTCIVVNQAWISSKLKLIATLWKIKKELFSKHFPRHFQSFCCKIHVYWVINSLPPVCSHAIRTILMVWVRITLGFQPRVIRTQTINIFSYCMNKQGITNSMIQIGLNINWTSEEMPGGGVLTYLAKRGCAALMGCFFTRNP